MLATALALVLYLLALAPLIWLLRPRLNAKRAAAIYGAAIIVIMVFETGIFSRGSLASTDVAHLISVDPAGDQCDRIHEVLTEADVILETGQGRLVVRAGLWQQMPAQVRDVVVACSARRMQPEVDATELEVIER